MRTELICSAPPFLETPTMVLLHLQPLFIATLRQYSNFPQKQGNIGKVFSSKHKNKMFY